MLNEALKLHGILENNSLTQNKVGFGLTRFHWLTILCSHLCSSLYSQAQDWLSSTWLIFLWSFLGIGNTQKSQACVFSYEYQHLSLFQCKRRALPNLIDLSVDLGFCSPCCSFCCLRKTHAYYNNWLIKMCLSSCSCATLVLGLHHGFSEALKHNVTPTRQHSYSLYQRVFTLNTKESLQSIF